MSQIDDNIVRLYFEMNGFFIRALRQGNAQLRAKRCDAGYCFVVYNPNYKGAAHGQPNVLLFSSELPLIECALVVVKGQHSPKFAGSNLRNSAAIQKFLEKEIVKQAEQLFQVEVEANAEMKNLLKILVIPGLPTHDPHKTQCIDILQTIGIDAVLSFKSILQDVVGKVEVNYSYSRSDTLQLVQLLKTYDMIKPQQLELFSQRKP